MGDKPTDYELWRDALMLAWSSAKWAERPGSVASTYNLEGMAYEARKFLPLLLRYQQEIPLYLRAKPNQGEQND